MLTKHALQDATITVKSGNRKTGPITTISRSSKTCPTTCPFLDNGCYGAGRMWAQVNKAARTTDDLPVPHDLIRDRVLGDVTLPEAGDDRIDMSYIADVNDWAQMHGSTVFGYTHSRLPEIASGALFRSAFPSYAMNVSCETVDEVAHAVSNGWDAVIASDDVEHGQMVGDKRIVQCPATARDDVTCDTCRLCAKTDRTAVVWFPLHGVQVRKARAAVRGKTLAGVS